MTYSYFNQKRPLHEVIKPSSVLQYLLTHSLVPNWREKKLARWLPATLARQPAFLLPRYSLFPPLSVSPIPYLAYRVLVQSPPFFVLCGICIKGKEGRGSSEDGYVLQACYVYVYIYALDRILPGSGKGGWLLCVIRIC